MTLFIIILFAVGYLAIIFEHVIKINKAATAMLTGVLCWVVVAITHSDNYDATEMLAHHLGDVAAILFFLLGAMTIVELIDAHDGFQVIIDQITTNNKKKLVWIIALFAFFLSAVLDNLTTAIVMVSMLSKIIVDKEERWLLAGLVVIAANAGGAWSPIGDVTTTMLWTGKQITTADIIVKTFLPSLVCLIVPTAIIAYKIKGKLIQPEKLETNLNFTTSKKERNAVFFIGLACLLFVPVFKAITHLPPYMGILFGLGIMWIVTELIHHKKDEEEKGLLSVNHALRKIDTPSVLFFLGILLSIAALQTTGILSSMAKGLDASLGNINLINIAIGLLSAVVDNVPLVAAAQGMYPLEQYATGHYFWNFLAYAAGTGGSILIIGSAAGVAAMGIEKMSFFWYLKKIGWLALVGFLAGAFVFIMLN